MATRDLRSYFTSRKNKENKSQTGIMAADASAVNAELESFSEKKECNTSTKY